MLRDVLKHLINRRPFKAFEVTVTSGDVFPVPHPEVAILGEYVLAVLVRSGENRMEEPEMVWIDYGHIAHCRPLPNWQAPF